MKEKVVTNLSDLTETQLQQVADYLEFLKFRERREDPPRFDDAELEVIYAEFGAEDRELAEAGMAKYAAGLEREDAHRRLRRPSLTRLLRTPGGDRSGIGSVEG